MKTRGDEIAERIEKKIRGGEFGTWDQLWDSLRVEEGLTEDEVGCLTHILRGQLQMMRYPAITKIELFLTEKCPLRCDYCFVQNKDTFSTMPIDVARQAVDFLMRESRDKEELSILFFGGEPLSAFHLIREIVPYAEAAAAKNGKKLDFSMTTNGVLFTEEKLAFCRDHRLRFLLSLDGARASHDRHRKSASGRGSFDLVYPKIALMKRYQPWLGSRVTAHPDTAADLAENIQYLHGIGINQFLISPASGVGWDDGTLAEYERQIYDVMDWYREIKKSERRRMLRISSFEITRKEFFGKQSMWGCRAGRYTVTVYTNGNIYPCSKMLGVNGMEGLYRLGDVWTGITEIAARDELTGLVRIKREKCEACEYRDCCTGGCFAVNCDETGCIFSPSDDECKLMAMTNRIANRLFALEGDEPFAVPKSA